MIEKLFNHPHLLHQTPDNETDVAHEAIAGHIDNGGTIVLSQEGRHICIDRVSVAELCKLLKELATL